MLTTQRRLWARAALLGLVLAGCGNDDTTMVSAIPSGSSGAGSGETGTDVGNAGSGGDTQPPPCVESPVTHLEIINACTNSVKVRKTPALTLLQPDGTLPPP